MRFRAPEDTKKKAIAFPTTCWGKRRVPTPDAERYFQRYVAAIDAVGLAGGPLHAQHADAIIPRPSISVKLSALHPRFEAGHDERLLKELLPRLNALVQHAMARGLGITVDAEEQDRLEPTLSIFGEAFINPAANTWQGLGINRHNRRLWRRNE